LPRRKRNVARKNSQNPSNKIKKKVKKTYRKNLMRRLTEKRRWEMSETPVGESKNTKKRAEAPSCGGLQEKRSEKEKHKDKTET